MGADRQHRILHDQWFDLPARWEREADEVVTRFFSELAQGGHADDPTPVSDRSVARIVALTDAETVDAA